MRDKLTGLLDRAGLNKIIESQLAHSLRQNSPFGLILFDIDRLKLINYGFGDEQGDAVLQAVARASKQKLRDQDWVGRWSGQQFLCVLPNTDCRRTDALAEELRALTEALVVPIGIDFTRVTASFGVACFPDDGRSTQSLMATAEAALNKAKESGRNRIVHGSHQQRQMYSMGTLLDAALKDNRVVPAYQLIVDVRTGKIVAEEALARIVTEQGRIVEAEDFIEVARELQLTYKIDRAIIVSTFARLVATLLQGSRLLHFVNISANLLRHPKLVEELLALARKHCEACGELAGPLKPLVIEVTERELLGDTKGARELLSPFLDFGVQLALDDFGSGYSSFRYLADLPFSFLKIEGTLIKRLDEPKVRAIVQGIQRTAADLGLITLAECIEDERTAQIVSDIGIDWGQGFHYDKPLLPQMLLLAKHAARVPQPPTIKKPPQGRFS